MELVKIEFLKTLKRKDAVLLLLLSLWPVIVSIGVRMNSGFFIMEGTQFGAVEFVSGQVIFQYTIFLPILLALFVTSMTFFQELKEKQIYLYKDIPRVRILNAKYTAIYLLFLLYILLYIVNAFISFYLIFKGAAQSSPNFTSSPDYLLDTVLSGIQIIIVILFYIHIGITLSLRYSTGATLFGAVMVYIMSMMMETLGIVKYLTPLGYADTFDFPIDQPLLTFVIFLGIFFIYNIPLYFTNQRYFKKMDFI